MQSKTPALSQDEQKFAKMFLADVQNGDAKLEPGLAFYDYVQKYIKQAKDDLIHAHAEGMGIDEQKLRDFADAHPNVVNLNLNKRFDLLMETIDKTKAKAYIEKIRGGVTIKPKDVMIEADEIDLTKVDPKDAISNATSRLPKIPWRRKSAEK